MLIKIFDLTNVLFYFIPNSYQMHPYENIIYEVKVCEPEIHTWN